MKKSVLKIAAIAFAATLVTGVWCTASAAESNATDINSGIVTPRYTDIHDWHNDLSVSSSGVLSIEASTSVYAPNTAGVKVELQRNGSTFKTWTDRGGISASVSETYSVASGSNTYRLRVTYTAYNSSGTAVETLVSYSDEVTY